MLLLGTLWVNYASEQRKVESSSEASKDGIYNEHADVAAPLLVDP